MNRKFIDSNIDNEDAIMKYFNLMERLSKKDERFATQMEKDADYIERTYDMNGGSRFSRWREKRRARKQGCPELEDFLEKYGKIMEEIPKKIKYLDNLIEFLNNLSDGQENNKVYLNKIWKEEYARLYKFVKKIYDVYDNNFRGRLIYDDGFDLFLTSNKDKDNKSIKVLKFIFEDLRKSLKSFGERLNYKKGKIMKKCATKGLEDL